jgi:pimeloyl-ACP methyl ester carboxylesterase
VLTTLLGGRAFAERFGAENHVVALHGWARSRADWTPVLGGFDALALDLPGFGAAPPPESGWSTAEYADFVADVLAELDRPVLVGHSFGGRVAVHLVAKRPELVRGLVLTGVPLYPLAATGSRPKLAYRLGRWAHRKGLLPEARMEALRQRHGSADYRAARGVMREVLVKAVNEDYSAQVEAVAATDVPVRLVWGEHDTAAPVWMAERARDVLGDHATLTVVPGASHLLETGLGGALQTAIRELLA